MPRSFSTTGTTIVDTAADIPTASAAYEGVMVFQKDTNELKICDGASWISTIDTDAPPGLVLIKTVSFTNANTISITSCFSAAYTNYRVVASMTGSSFFTIGMQLMSGSTPAGGTAYNWVQMYIDGTTGPSRSTTTSTDRIPLGNSGATMCIYTAEITSPFQASKTGFLTLGTGGSQYITITGGDMATASSYDGLYFLNNTAGTNTGSVRVYGYRD